MQATLVQCGTADKFVFASCVAQPVSVNMAINASGRNLDNTLTTESPPDTAHDEVRPRRPTDSSGNAELVPGLESEKSGNTARNYSIEAPMEGNFENFCTRIAIPQEKAWPFT